jgi:hypothetical protein
LPDPINSSNAAGARWRRGGDPGKRPEIARQFSPVPIGMRAAVRWRRIFMLGTIGNNLLGLEAVAYRRRRSALTPADIDFFEVHDA